MSESTDPRLGIGGNRPPITPPAEADCRADLERRYPEIKTKLDEFEKALATYPQDITDSEVAESLQDLLGQMKKNQRAFKANRAAEKEPWNGVIKIVQNFFSKAEEKIDGWLEVWQPRYQAFLDRKAEEGRRAAEAEAEKQRFDAERLRKEAEAAEGRRVAAEKAAAEAAQREQQARERREDEERRAAEAKARAEAAAAEEKRLAEEKRQRDKAEREQNAANLREAKRLMKQAENLHLLAEGEEANADEIAGLDMMVRTGGTIGNLGTLLFHSALLSDDERAEVNAIRNRLHELRVAFNDRASAKERKRREKEHKAAEEQAAREAEERARIKAEEDAKLAAARAERERAEADAAAAKATARDTGKEISEARRERQGAASAATKAGREAGKLDTDADRTENRADRLDRRLGDSTDADFSRTRGDLGTVGSLTGMWKHDIQDEAALRAVCGPLGQHLTSDALSGAVYRWMVAHREGFPEDSERVTDPALPGVVFVWERTARIA